MKLVLLSLLNDSLSKDFTASKQTFCGNLKNRKSFDYMIRNQITGPKKEKNPLK